MKKAKFIIAFIIISFSLISSGFAYNAKNDENGSGKMIMASTVLSLNNQLYDEILNVLNLPVYLAYEDKNIKGDAYVTIKVNENGKLVIVKIFGENEMMNKFLKSKISSRNLWTPQKYANLYFRYKVHIS
jgi:hypothetical protein